MQNLTATIQPAQVAPNKPDCQSLVNAVGNHIQAAARITDVDDMRYFNIRDLQQVRINLHLALELLEVLRRASVPSHHQINQ